MGYWDKETKAEMQADEPEISLEELEQTSLKEIQEVEAGFRERMKQENDRFRDMCDTEYWFCVCFTSRKQKEEFLEKIGIETDLKYIEGKEMARAYKRALKTPDLEFAKVRPFDQEFLNISSQKAEARTTNE